VVLLVILNSSFSVIFVEGLSEPSVTFEKLAQVSTTGRTDFVEVVDDVCFSFDFKTGFSCYDVKEASNPVLLDNIAFANSYDPNVKGGHDFIIHDDIAIVNFIHSGIKIFDISSPEELILLSEWDSGGEYYYISFEGNRIYCAKAGNGLEILELSEDNTLSLAGHFTNGNNLYFVNCYNDIVFINDHAIDKTRILNTSDSLNVVDLGILEQMIIDAVFIDDLMYAACGGDGFQIFNISKNIVRPELISKHDDGGMAFDIDIVQNIGFLSDDTDGLEIIDLTDVCNISEIAQYTNGDCVNLDIDDNKVFLAKQEKGWEIINFQGINFTTSSYNCSEIQSRPRSSPTGQFIISFSVFICIISRRKKKTYNDEDHS
jgi:hypothetical protein